MRLTLPAIILSLLLADTSGASDLIREHRIAEQIEDAILVGEPLRLEAGELEFMAIHTDAETDPPKGGVIILHGRGAHPDWVDVVQPLRSELPEFGWETLSLQMPVAASDAGDGAYRALVPEAFPRIEAGVKYFKDRGLANILLLGHSLGGRMAVDYVATEGAGEIKALVVVGLSIHKDENGAALRSLEKIDLPVLDIYGSRDLDAVHKTAKERANAARRAGNTAYRQMEVQGGDHFFNGLSKNLVTRVRAWIDRFGGTGDQTEYREDPEKAPPAGNRG
jgi:pimeloyl-ACP methyl ester carboxylesterase